ncbi:hypothetical protein [Cetobacterium sp.]|uniref:hypothetical protein n=1 Tax=Cetobacterium sp. TaxID=2071632 RepID=UPI003F347612
MESKQKDLIKLSSLLNTELNIAKNNIAKAEQDLRKLKQKKSRLEARIAKVNGEIVKANNGGKEIPIFFYNTKGMV